MALAMVVPLVADRRLPRRSQALRRSLSLGLPDHESRSRGMRAGGIWPALLGTIYLVVISLRVAAPIGVLAAVYLNEYAKDNWFTRIINLAVVNLAGVPSIVHALFGLGAFVLFAGIGRSILAASLTLAIMTLPVIIASTKEALAAVPRSFREACWNVGATRWQTIRRIVLPNSISGILTGVILQVVAHGGRDRADHVHRRGLLQGDRGGRPLRLQSRSTSAWRSRCTSSRSSTQVPTRRRRCPTRIAVVLLGDGAARSTPLAIAFRVYLRSRKKW